MKNKPNPNVLHPVNNRYDLIFPANLSNGKNIIIGDFTYIRDTKFANHVISHVGTFDDKLIIGKFCQIGSNVKFVMNGANHQMDCASTYPFYIFQTWDHKLPRNDEFKNKGNIEIGNDVWIGNDVTILPGVKIGNGAIIGMNSVVGKDIPDYVIAIGNPIQIIKKRFDEETISLLLKYEWWNQSVEQINDDINMLTCNNHDHLKKWLRQKVLAK